MTPPPDTVSAVLAGLATAGLPARQVLDSAAHIDEHDFADAVDRTLCSTTIAAATDGQTGPALVLDRLREDGHLTREVDGRLTKRLADLAGYRVEPLQLPAHVVAFLREAERRTAAAYADAILEGVDSMPQDDLRELLRRFWADFRDIKDRVDAAAGRVGEPTERPHLRDVSA